MSPGRDHLVRALDRERNVRVLACACSGVAARARAMHQLDAGPAAALAQGLCAGLLLAGALEKGRDRINLQLSGPGPVAGLLVDASARGEVRGYVRLQGPVPAPRGRFDPRPALGSSGWLQVLRDLGGELEPSARPGEKPPSSDRSGPSARGRYYRGVVPLASPLAGDLEHYFEVSEQIETAVALEVVEKGGALAVAGLLVQKLPGESGAEEVQDARRRLVGGAALARAIEGGAADALDLLRAVWPERSFEVVADAPVRFACRCTRERVLDVLALLGADEVAQLRAEGQADIRCEFCGTRYPIDAEELEAIARRLAAREV